MVKGIILHGGSGTRLRPLTYSDVKQLLPVAGKPISEYALENLIKIGISEVNIVIGSVGGEDVKKYYGDGSRWKIKITYTYQEKPIGIAHAIGMCREFTGEDKFVVYLGDNFLQYGIRDMSNKFLETGCETLLALTEVDNPSQFGIAEVQNDRITKLVEKPKEPKSKLAITGIYFLSKSIYESIDKLRPSARGEYEITEALQDQIDNGEKVLYSSVKGWFKDTGTVSDFLDCNRLVLDSMDESTENSKRFNGRYMIGKDVKISGNSTVLGPCYIGSGTTVENSYIGPYTSIGSNCVIRNVEIGNSVIMDGAILEFEEKYHMRESLVGPNAKIRTDRNHSKTMVVIMGRDSSMEFK